MDRIARVGKVEHLYLGTTECTSTDFHRSVEVEYSECYDLASIAEECPLANLFDRRWYAVEHLDCAIGIGTTLHLGNAIVDRGVFQIAAFSEYRLAYCSHGLGQYHGSKIRAFVESVREVVAVVIPVFYTGSWVGLTLVIVCVAQEVVVIIIGSHASWRAKGSRGVLCPVEGNRSVRQVKICNRCGTTFCCPYVGDILAVDSPFHYQTLDDVGIDVRQLRFQFAWLGYGDLKRVVGLLWLRRCGEGEGTWIARHRELAIGANKSGEDSRGLTYMYGCASIACGLLCRCAAIGGIYDYVVRVIIVLTPVGISVQFESDIDGSEVLTSFVRV